MNNLNGIVNTCKLAASGCLAGCIILFAVGLSDDSQLAYVVALPLIAYLGCIVILLFVEKTKLVSAYCFLFSILLSGLVMVYFFGNRLI